jgi:hypothetical protein
MVGVGLVDLVLQLSGTRLNLAAGALIELRRGPGSSGARAMLVATAGIATLSRRFYPVGT